VGEPKVSLMEWENTVVFQLPVIQGLEPAEIKNVQYWVDDQYVAQGVKSSYEYYGADFLDDLGPGWHRVGARAVDHDPNALATSSVTWFLPGSFNELLVNGGFEDSETIPWDLSYSDVPPEVQVEENFIDSSIAFDGQRALRLGNVGEEGDSRVGQVVRVPKQIKSLTFSVRVKVSSAEDPDENPYDGELRLVTGSVDGGGFPVEKISEDFVAGHYDAFSILGLHDYFARYWRQEVSLQPGKYAGKKILVQLHVKENEGKPTAY
jgi:hypothetical protein